MVMWTGVMLLGQHSSTVCPALFEGLGSLKVFSYACGGSRHASSGIALNTSKVMLEKSAEQNLLVCKSLPTKHSTAPEVPQWGDAPSVTGPTCTKASNVPSPPQEIMTLG